MFATKELTEARKMSKLQAPGRRPSLLGMVAILSLACLTGMQASESGARARVETVDAKVWEGRIQWREGAVSITPEGAAPTQIEWSAVRRLVLANAPNNVSPISNGGNGLLGFYHAGTNFQGAPILRLDESIHFDWGWNILPLPGFRHDLFSIRWTGQLRPDRTDVYTLYLGADDGARFWLDGQGPFSMWRRQEYSETNCTMRLEAGRDYDLRVEYFDYFGSARVQLSWSSSSSSRSTIPKAYLHAHSTVPGHRADLNAAPGLLATYHVGIRFGEPSFSRVEPSIALDASVDFSPALQAAREDWTQTQRRENRGGFGQPDEATSTAEGRFARLAKETGPEIAPGVPAAFFTARWSGHVRPAASGVHVFRVLTDEGVRFWLNDELVIDKWDGIFPSENRHVAKLAADEPIMVRMETLNTDGHAVAQVFWEKPGAEETPLIGPELSPGTPGVRPIPEPEPQRLQVGGVLLTKGTFVPVQPMALDATSLRLGGPILNLSLPRPRVARIYFRPLTAEQQAQLLPGRTGALLENGDFIEGEVLSLNGTDARIDSVLFGRRTYHAPGPVIALVLKGTPLPEPNYRLAIKELGALFTSDIRVSSAGLVIPELVDHIFSANQIIDVVRLGPRE